MNIPSITNLPSNSFQATENQTVNKVNLPFGQTKAFPKKWGNPPQIQTCDWVQLPHGFGSGSSTLKNWILENIKNIHTPFVDFG